MNDKISIYRLQKTPEQLQQFIDVHKTALSFDNLQEPLIMAAYNIPVTPAYAHPANDIRPGFFLSYRSDIVESYEERY